jgi:hypothetical protein
MISKVGINYNKNPNPSGFGFLLVKENHQPGWWFQKALAMSRKRILL